MPRSRRAVLRSLFGAAAAASGAAAPLARADSLAPGVALTRAQRDRLTPDDVLELIRQGNLRFRTGHMVAHDYLAQKRATADGQFPAAAILGCIDSRVPPEIVLDLGVGDTFVARIAGNVSDDGLLGSLEFACAAAGARLVLVMGHTACGAIKGAIDGVELGHLTDLLESIKPAVAATVYSGERSSKNAAFVDAVARTNVLNAVAQLRLRSSVLAGLEREGRIRIVGSMYHLVGGRLELLS